MGIIEAIFGGARNVIDSKNEKAFVEAAATRLDSIDTDEARMMAQLVRDNPYGANNHVKKMYGGWDKMVNGLRARKQQDVLHGQLTDMSQAELADKDAYNAREAGLNIMPHAAYKQQTGFGMPEVSAAAGYFENMHPRIGQMAASGAFRPGDAQRAQEHYERTGDLGAALDLFEESEGRTKPTRKDRVGNRVLTYDPEGNITGEEIIDEDREKFEKVTVRRLAIHNDILAEMKAAGKDFSYSDPGYKKAMRASGVEPFTKNSYRTALGEEAVYGKDPGVKALVGALGRHAIAGESGGVDEDLGLDE